MARNGTLILHKAERGQGGPGAMLVPINQLHHREGEGVGGGRGH